MYHLILVESGLLQACTVDGEFTARPGDFVCFRPAPRNSYGVAPGTVIYQAHLSFAPPPRDHWPLWLDPIGPLPGRLALGDHFAEMRTVFESLCLELDKQGDLHSLRAVAAVHQILALLVQAASGANPERTRLDAWQRARLRLEQELAREIRVGLLARELGFSTDHFIRHFKSRFGLSPMEYRTRARLREAVRLLRGTDLAVKQIAFQLGWQDADVLAAHCRQLLGRSPTDIRSGQSAADLTLPGEKLYPVNLHVVPPGSGPDWFEQWMLPDRPWDIFTKASALKLSGQRAAQS
jgi:AraC-like DNA-binding protein